MLSAEEWAVQQWGTARLGDVRRNRVAVELGRQMVANPAASLAQQMGSWRKLKAAYRLLNNKAVSLAALLEPHRQQTLEQAGEQAVVLFPEDTTELDYTAHPSKQGLGPIGDGKGRGMLLHTTLAVVPDQRQLLGVAHAEVVLRQPAPKPRPKWTRTPEGRVWQTSVLAVGPPPPGVRWVHVSDRGGDVYEYWWLCRVQQKDFLSRVFRNRRLARSETADEGCLLDNARQLPQQPQSAYEVPVAKTKKLPARRAQVVLSWGEVRIAPPQQAPADVQAFGPLQAWVVRAWEPAPPPKAKPVEWILLTSCPVTTLAQAQQMVAWYTCRWLCEDFHQCLKTGLRIERSQLDDGADVQRLLGFAIPVAAFLLQLRQQVRHVPEVPAHTHLDPLLVRLLAGHLKQDAASMSVSDFWRGVAQLGGHLGRRSDGMPGWRTLWQGYRTLATWADGARLASRFT